MPKESKNYPEITQKLLRRARQGHIFHNPTPVTNGKDDKTKGATKEAEGGYVAKKWTLVARDQEAAEEPTYLAKRRKGLPPMFGAGVANINPQASFRTTKVKKYDADGKMHVYEVLAPEGQQVEGEIVAEDEAAKAVPVEPIAAAPGTVVEGVGVVNDQGVVVSNDLLLPTPPRRKPPPPRRKPKKGPGRGKKKVLFNEGDAAAGEGATSGGLLNVPGIAAEQATDSAQPSSQADTPMPDAGDDEEGSGSEGEEGDEGDEGREEGELSPSLEPEKEKSEQPTEPPPTNNEPVTAPMPTTEVKEEQKDEDAMMVDSDAPADGIPTSAPTEPAQAAVAAAAAAAAAPSSLPGLASQLKSPSLPPAQPTDTSSSAVATVLADHASSPDIPLATSSTTIPTDLPGLDKLAETEDDVVGKTQQAGVSDGGSDAGAAPALPDEAKEEVKKENDGDGTEAVKKDSPAT